MIVVSEQVRQALADRVPVVAMESTIYSTLGLPVPHNAEALRRCRAAVEAGGAVPAVTAVVDGRWRVGLSAEEEERVLLGTRKVAERDLADFDASASPEKCTPSHGPPSCHASGGRPRIAPSAFQASATEVSIASRVMRRSVGTCSGAVDTVSPRAAGAAVLVRGVSRTVTGSGPPHHGDAPRGHATGRRTHRISSGDG